MVVVLDDHLAQLEAQVVVHLTLDVVAHEGNLLPDEHTAAVGLVEHVVGLWIVGQTERVDAHLLDDVEVGIVLLVGEGRSVLCPVLVAADATQLQVTAVEEEALVLIDPEVTQADGVLDAVDLLAVAAQDGHGLVEIGVGHAVPKVWAVDTHVEPCAVVLDVGRTGRSYGVACGIEHAELHFAALVSLGLAEQMHFGAELGMLLVDAVLMDEHALRAVVERRDADVVGDFEPNVAVEAAEDVEVTRLGGHVELVRVVAGHRDIVLLAVVEVVGEFDGESVVGALVYGDVAEVDHHAGHAGCAFELDEDALAAPCLRHFDLLGVGAFAAIVSGIVHEVIGIERMGQVDHGVGTRHADVGIDTPGHERTFLVLPFGVERLHFTGLYVRHEESEKGGADKGSLVHKYWFFKGYLGMLRDIWGF